MVGCAGAAALACVVGVSCGGESSGRASDFSICSPGLNPAGAGTKCPVLGFSTDHCSFCGGEERTEPKKSHPEIKGIKRTKAIRRYMLALRCTTTSVRIVRRSRVRKWPLERSKSAAPRCERRISRQRDWIACPVAQHLIGLGGIPWGSAWVQVSRPPLRVRRVSPLG